MDEKSFELYQEEQRQQLIALNRGVGELLTVFRSNLAVEVKNPTERQEIAGEVKVSNPQKTVEVENMQDVVESLEDLGSKLTKAIEDSKTTPVTEVSIKNIEQAKQKTVSITNLDDLKQYFDDVAKSIEDNQPIVNVSKQVVEFPTLASKPIAVRLSDGKKFYNALATMASNFNTNGLATSAKQDEIVTAIGNIGGSTNYTTRIAEKSDNTNITYIGNAVIGTATSAASWQIKRFDSTSGLIKLWADGDDSFNNIWDNRESLSYS